MSSLTNAQKRDLKGRAQLLEPILKLGHAGASPAFIASLNAALDAHQLVKIRFTDFKEEKKAIAPTLAEATASELIMRVGNVAVYYRGKNSADPSARSESAPTE